MFYDRVKGLCDENGVKITNLLTELNMSPGNITRWKSGTIPDANTLVKLAQHFNVSTDYLLGIDDVKSRLLAALDTTPNFQDPQIQALAKYYSKCDADGQFRIIHTALTEFERCEEERKKEAQRAVAELKAT